MILSTDTDEEVAGVARQTIDGLPLESLARFLARGDVSTEVRAFFAARGVVAAGAPADGDAWLVQVPEDGLDEVGPLATDEDADVAAGPTKPQPLSTLTVMQRIKLAMNGTREQRGVLIRDPNRHRGRRSAQQPEAQRDRNRGDRPDDERE